MARLGLLLKAPRPAYFELRRRVMKLGTDLEMRPGSRFLTAGLVFLALVRPASSATVGFKPAVTYPVGTAPVAVASGDFNGDAKVDLAVANNGNAAVGDDGNVSILLGNGDGSFQPANNFAAGKNPFAIAAADFNGDGRADLVLIDSSGVGVRLGNGDGTFGPATYFPTATGPLSLAVADVDRDNKPDLVVAARSLSILLGNGDGTFQAHVDYLGSGAASVVVADLNSDGKVDVVRAAGTTLATVLLGNGDGTFQNPIVSRVGLLSGKQLVVSDFNRDGKPDTAVSFLNLLARSSGTIVALGNGDGTFQLPSSINVPSFGAIAATDFNGDGKADLATVSGGTVNLFLGNGDGTFRVALTSVVGTGPWGGIAGEFNQDKAPDLVVTNSADNTVSILLNVGIDFSISASTPTPSTVSRGQSSTSTITLNLLNGFDNPVALSCSVQPAQSAPACSLNPTSVAFDANGNATATLTINTTTASAALQHDLLHTGSGSALLWLPVSALALVGTGFGCRRAPHRKLMGYFLGGVLMLGLIFQAGCGGSTGSSGNSTRQSLTYTITITATSGSTQRSTTVPLTVQ